MGSAMQADALREVAPEIWDMMLGLSLEGGDDTKHVFPDDIRTISGLVTVVGDWTGAVTVEATTEAARRFAAAMFGSDDPESMSLEEVRDAHAELTNMTGGNVKNLLEGVCKLGIPTVTEGVGYTVHLPRTEPIHQLTYRCGTDEVVITVLEARH